MKTKIILVLTDGRSGSTNLIKLFENFKNITVCSELFNENDVYSSKYEKDLIIKKYGEKYLEKTTDPKYHLEILKYLSENSNKEFFIFKIMLFQTTSEFLEKMIKDNLIYHIIILERKNMIDKFISQRKAELLNKWQSYDTTNTKIKFNIINYGWYKKYRINLHKEYFRLLKKNYKYYTYIEYNETINFDSIIKKIKGMFPELILKDNSNKCLKIQDKSKNYNDKIENYDEVKDFIEEELKTFNI